jgi:diguanylate cyclase (GGDEF)-like protein
VTGGFGNNEDLAHEAAAAAPYGDIARLLRLLGMIGTAAPVTETVESTLMVLADALRAELVCVASVVGDRIVPSAAYGLAADDPLFRSGWPLGPAGREALDQGSPVARAMVTPPECPPHLHGVPAAAGAWIPLTSGADPADELLMLFRLGGRGFYPAELQVLSSAAYRMSSAVEALERANAIERLAQGGPGLARHVDLTPLLDEAVVLLRDLIGTDSAFIVTFADDLFALAAHTGTDESIVRRWPRTTRTMPNWDVLSTGRAYVGPREVIAERPDETNTSPTVLCVPVVRDGTVVALLGATGHRSRSFGKTGVDIATILANYLSAAITNADLYRTLKQRERELQRRAASDPLTGLANRTQLGQRIAAGLADTDHHALGLLFCDIDKFKAVNDRLGHEIGDELLQQVALRLRTAIRPGDVLARFGGDEFVVLVHGVRDLADVTAAGRVIQGSLAAPFAIRGEQFHVSASIGAVLGRPGSSASVMLRSADAAMYAAKAKGAGRIEVFDDDASNRSTDRLELEAGLAFALERGELSIVYQPLCELKTRKILAFEALLRWRHPERGAVPPDMFIGLAEDMGLIVPIGAWVLSESCRRLAEWHRLFPAADLNVGVNISALQLEHSSQDLLDLILRAGANPHDVWLEVTERMDTSGDIADQVARLRSAGVHFALDDFGMSYSSLTYLKRFPVEGIKIDRTFVTPMTEDGTQRAIVQAILALGASLSINVVAEGIETNEQIDALLDLGCAYGQGYLLGHPLTADECVSALRAQL